MVEGLRRVSISKYSLPQGIFEFDIIRETNEVTVVEKTCWDHFVAYLLNYFTVVVHLLVGGVDEYHAVRWKLE